MNRGEMSARLETDTSAARNLLLDNLPALRDRLAQHDIKIQHFDVDVMDRSTGGMSDQSAQYRDPSNQTFTTNRPVRNAAAAGAETAVAAESSGSRRSSESGRLNIIV
jgi:flagellar hook-length control protein FliK